MKTIPIPVKSLLRRALAIFDRALAQQTSRVDGAIVIGPRFIFRVKPLVILLIHKRNAKSPSIASQRSLQNEPIFRLLLKVAVIGAHQCESLLIFRGDLPQLSK